MRCLCCGRCCCYCWYSLIIFFLPFSSQFLAKTQNDTVKNHQLKYHAFDVCVCVCFVWYRLINFHVKTKQNQKMKTENTETSLEFRWFLRNEYTHREVCKQSFWITKQPKNYWNNPRAQSISDIKRRQTSSIENKLSSLARDSLRVLTFRHQIKN